MANTSGDAYGLTTLIPIKNGNVESKNDVSYASYVREILQGWPSNEYADAPCELSPMAKVPNTYLCRFYVLNDVFYEGRPAVLENLKSKYLVFSSNFYGDRDTYLSEMWHAVSDDLKPLLECCVAFQETVKDARDFVSYIKRCQVDNDLFFNGSVDANLPEYLNAFAERLQAIGAAPAGPLAIPDDTLAEQLKALYLKQALTHFVYNHMPAVQSQEESAAELQRAFQTFVERVQPSAPTPTWPAGIGKEPEGIRDL